MRDLDMRTFIAVARNRHFGRTAAEMNTTQPAISSRIATLEGELGYRLIERGDREFRLTPQGEAALKTFEEVLARIDALKGPPASDPALEPLRIGAIDSVASTWMPLLIETLHARFANLRIELTVDGTKPLVGGMMRGDFDIIYCLHPVLDDAFRSYAACTWQMIWAGSPKLIDPERVYSVAALAEMPIISFPKNSPPFQMIAPYFHTEQVLASKLTSCNSLFAIINLLIDGFGVAAIPTVTIERELKQELLAAMRVAKRFPPMPIIGTFQATTHQTFIREVVDEAKRTVAHYCANHDPSAAWVD